MIRKIHVSNGAIVTDVLSTKQYIKEIKRRSITPAQSTELTQQMSEGNLVARNRLIEGNLRFVIQVSRSYQGMGLELEDLIAFGNIGLFEAADRFDASKNVKFITFAVWYIRSEIQKALNDLSRVVRIPSHRTKTEPQHIKSIHTPVGDDDNKETYADRYLAADAVKTNRERTDMHFDLNRTLAQLKPKQEEAIRRNYGFGFEYEQSMDQIAEEMGITGERARQLVRQAELALKGLPGIKLLEQYL